MATIKSYTDIEQSKKLVELLPLDSVDMYYYKDRNNDFVQYAHFVEEYQSVTDRNIVFDDNIIPCWSLAALLSVLPDVHLKKYIYNGTTKYYATLTGIMQFNSEYYDNPVDACYGVLIKLHF